MRKYYFFQHQLDANKDIPGRYAFDVKALIANRSRCLGEKIVRVPIDSFEENIPGPNIDPCPFANPFHIVHSFCKISNNQHVVSNKILSDIVSKNDIIFYGCLRYSKINSYIKPIYLAIDTVLVVNSTIKLNTIKINGKYKFLVKNDMLLSQNKDSNSDLWRYNLKDTDEGGFHECTHINGHKIIIGKSDTKNPNQALSKRETSYIPLTVHMSRQLPPILTNKVDVDLWRLLTDWCKKNQYIDINELDEKLGEKLYTKLIDISGQNSEFEGFVAIPPLEWVGR